MISLSFYQLWLPELSGATVVNSPRRDGFDRQEEQLELLLAFQIQHIHARVEHYNHQPGSS